VEAQGVRDGGPQAGEERRPVAGARRAGTDARRALALGARPRRPSRERALRRARERGDSRPPRQRHRHRGRGVMTRVAPFAAWDSPLSAAQVAAASLMLGGLTVDGDDVWWIEGRPAEDGRAALVRWRSATGPG